MHQHAKLRWQCRRGTKELDFMLLRYLDSGYVIADDEEKAQFVELLAFEDDELVGVLMGELGVEEEEMKLLIEKIKTFAVVGV